jgi:hypothetical protein
MERFRPVMIVQTEKPKRHHWWPECVSKHWADAEGGVHWILPTGEIRKIRPASLGVIGNGHSIRFGDGNEPTPWDVNFEAEFQQADDHFPDLIRWLDTLDRSEPPFEAPRAKRFFPQTIDDDQLNALIECVVSLAVRSPMHRARAVALAEEHRGPLPERERNVLIGANMQRVQSAATKSLSGGGKAVVIFSPEREFIFGDGFFHNIFPPGDRILSPKILAPITPWMSILFTRPSSYHINPRLCTLTLNQRETDELNHAVQVYAKDKLFYRSEKPALSESYKASEHRVFANDRNSVDRLIFDIPGIYPRDNSLDFLDDYLRR